MNDGGALARISPIVSQRMNEILQGLEKKYGVPEINK